MAMLPGFIGPAYSLINKQADCQTCKNFYLEVIESGNGKNGAQAQLVSTRGLDQVISILNGYSRGGYIASNGVCYWAAGSKLYRITTGITAVEIGTITAGTTPVQFTDNGVDLFLLATEVAYKVNLTSNVLSLVTGSGVSTFTTLTYMDTYIVFSKADSNQFYWTDPLDNTIPALNFASAESNPDEIVGLVNLKQDLWIFGKKTTELWYNYGQGNTVFAQREGLTINTGCASPFTIKMIRDTLIWLAIDAQGGPMLMKADGYSPSRISTFPIEQVWMDLTSAQWELATANVYQEGGHYFYVLNIPGLDSTWVYDLSTSEQMQKPCWHERQSNDGNSNFFRNVAEGHVFFNGKHYVGSYADNNLYELSAASYQDAGFPIIRERTSPHISNEMKTIIFDRLQFDFLCGAQTDQLITPQVMLEFSDDGGYTWSPELWETTSGSVGQYSSVVQFRRLGSSRDRVFRITCSDEIYWAVSNASMDVRMGTH